MLGLHKAFKDHLQKNYYNNNNNNNHVKDANFEKAAKDNVSEKKLIKTIF